MAATDAAPPKRGPRGKRGGSVRAVQLPSGQVALVQDGTVELEEDRPAQLEEARPAGLEEVEPLLEPPSEPFVPPPAPSEPIRPPALPASLARFFRKEPVQPPKRKSSAGKASPRAPRIPRPVSRPAHDAGGLVLTAGNPVPEGTVSGTVRTRDGVTLRVATFPASARPTRGTVVILQGRSEFIEKYFETAADLGRRGFCVATFDFRGQGRSQRLISNVRKGHVDDFHAYSLDVEAVMRGLVLTDCPPPYFILAHSMGSLVALQAAAARPLWFGRIVLSAPLFGVPPGQVPPGAHAALAGLDLLGLGAAFVPGGGPRSIQLRAFPGNPFTSDIARYRRTARLIRAAPDLCLGSPTIGWLRAATRAIAEVTSNRFLAGLATPVLAVAAGGDRIVDNAAIELFGSAVRVGGTVTLPNAQHELLVERDPFRALFWAAFDEFVPGSSLMS